MGQDNIIISKELSMDDMEYIALVAAEFCHDKLNSSVSDSYKKFIEQMSISNACNEFTCRYSILENNFSANHKQFVDENTIQHKINNYGYERDKFWLLILFLADFTNTCFSKSLDPDKVTIGDTVDKMIKLLNENDSTVIVKTKNESCEISFYPIKPFISTALEVFIEKNPILKDYYTCTEITGDNVLAHRQKFFIDLLDYFLANYNNVYKEINKCHKDWAFIAQCLYLAGFLKEEKYFYGYEEWVNPKGEKQRSNLKYVGKIIKDSTKNCKNTAKLYNSLYYFNPAEIDL
jgi:hypothetical protein